MVVVAGFVELVEVVFFVLLVEVAVPGYVYVGTGYVLATEGAS